MSATAMSRRFASSDDFLARVNGSSRGDAKRAIDTARRLRLAPGAASDAFDQGRLSVGEADAISAAAALDPSAEDRLVERATTSHDLADVRERADKVKAAARQGEDPAVRRARLRALAAVAGVRPRRDARGHGPLRPRGVGAGGAGDRRLPGGPVPAGPPRGPPRTDRGLPGRRRAGRPGRRRRSRRAQPHRHPRPQPATAGRAGRVHRDCDRRPSPTRRPCGRRDRVRRAEPD